MNHCVNFLRHCGKVAELLSVLFNCNLCVIKKKQMNFFSWRFVQSIQILYNYLNKKSFIYFNLLILKLTLNIFPILTLFYLTIVTWEQTEELYEEILYEILHNVGCDAENETCQNALFTYIQEAFKVIHRYFNSIWLGTWRMRGNKMNFLLIAGNKCSPRWTTFGSDCKRTAIDAFECGSSWG